MNRCYETKTENGKRLFNFKEKEIFQREADHKKIITICYCKLSSAGYGNAFYEEMEKSLRYTPPNKDKFREDKIKFREEMKRSLQSREESNPENIYRELYKLRGIFITTNADILFDEFFYPENVVAELEHCSKSDIEQTRSNHLSKLYHIHGYITDRGSLVFTLPEYMRRYKDQTFQEFLTTIFKKYTVLFVGYGLGEFEVLDFLLKDKESRKKIKKKHYMLAPYFKGEENILKSEQSYYDGLDVKLLPYAKDENGYAQLYKVVKDWGKEINNCTNHHSKITDDIDDAINSFSPEKIGPTLQKIRDDLPFEKYFFMRLIESKQTLRWLDSLDGVSYFSARNNLFFRKIGNDPNISQIPIWPLKILCKICEEANQMDGEERDALLQKINLRVEEFIDVQLTEDRLENPWVDGEIITLLSALPVSYISEKYIDFVKTSLLINTYTILINTMVGPELLPHLIKNNAKKHYVLRVLEAVMRLPLILEESRGKENSCSEEYLAETLKKNKDALAHLYPFEVANIVLEIMRDILKSDKYRFRLCEVHTDEDPDQKESDDYESQFVYVVRDMLENCKPSQIEDLVKEWLVSQHEIFRRLAFHLIDHHYRNLSKLFWELSKNPLERSFIRELYDLIRHNAPGFNDEQVDKMINWIETLERFSKSDGGSEGMREQVYIGLKKDWLFALLPCGRERVQDLYDHYHAINDVEPTPPEPLILAGIVEEVSPISKDAFLTMGNAQKAEYMNFYISPRMIFSHDSFKEESLVFAVKEFTREDPENLSQDLAPFLKVKLEYQIALLEGFGETWENENEIDWAAIFAFIVQIITEDDFWKPVENSSSADQGKIIHAISNLIIAGVQTDDHAFSAEYFPDAEKVLMILFSKYKEGSVQEDSSFSLEDHPIDFLLTSKIGSLLIAVIGYSLRYERVCTEERQLKPEIKAILTERLNTPGQTISTAAAIARYLNSLHAIDPGWILENFRLIFNEDDLSHWEIAMYEFLSRNFALRKPICHELKKGGHYAKSISHPFPDEIKKRLVWHISLGYLYDWDALDDEESLLLRLLQEGDSEHFAALMDFVLKQEKNKSKIVQFETKIRRLWKTILKELKTRKLSKQSTVSLNLICWLQLFEEIDDELFDLAETSLPYVTANEGFSQLITLLIGLAPKSPQHVASLFLGVTRLFLEIIQSWYYYSESDIIKIRKILRILYESGETENANRIYNLYFQKDHWFLRDLFKKYNPSDSPTG